MIKPPKTLLLLWTLLALQSPLRGADLAQLCLDAETACKTEIADLKALNAKEKKYSLDVLQQRDEAIKEAAKPRSIFPPEVWVGVGAVIGIGIVEVAKRL